MQILDTSMLSYCAIHDFLVELTTASHSSRGPGSTRCIARLPCTNRDYVPVWSPCDSNGTMQQSYKWIEPIICNTQLGVALPQAEKPIACRPCALGTEPLNHTHCTDCQVDKPSLSATCLHCGADRVPIYGILYDSWSRFPPHLKTWCTTLGGERELLFLALVTLHIVLCNITCG
ncbi:hypothetical protein EG68_12473 [Paragonimus skrjabini miyazakii]|uniref:Uncharacterized protein n=1 Tax=Paragonimus skrjabini miyazakii TaxID=59628 RepID=A0A8S9YI53_9TREM|nr:hypothetical protein EG68_12473 [Paragonimus skrjabini miyazakii]